MCVSFKCELRLSKWTKTFQLSTWVTGSDYSLLSWREITDLDTALLVTTRCWNVFPFFWHLLLVTMVSVSLHESSSVLSWGELSRVWSHCESCTFFFRPHCLFTQVERLVQSQLYRTWDVLRKTLPPFSCFLVSIFSSCFGRCQWLFFLFSSPLLQ